MNDQNKWQADLKSPDVSLRAAAAENLCLAGDDSVGAAVELVRACGDDESVRRWAVAALEDLGPPNLDALQSLADLATSTNSIVAYWAVTLLGRLGPSARSTQNILADLLSESKEVSVRERAAWALGKIGATTDDAMMALKQSARSDNPRLARLALAAMPQPPGSACSSDSI